MTRLTILLLLLIATLSLQAQSGKEIFTVNESDIIVDVDRNRITFDDFMAKMDTGDYWIETSQNEEGTTIFVLRPATADEKESMLSELGDLGEDKTGQKAPAYSFTATDGSNMASKDMMGKVVVLNFWFTKCKPCINEMPALNQVYDKYKSNPDVVFMAPSYEAKETIETFLADQDFRYPTAALAQKQARVMGVDGYPANIVIDRQGNYSLFFIGSVVGIEDIITRSIERALK